VEGLLKEDYPCAYYRTFGLGYKFILT
jgi:hypothetical protein